ncbi:Amuc_1100 family pilus-like protein [Verrucomicrobiales bacterium]|nr:Amuc_1100 family pilus-like protein [Verrucomicrobiales bacterium]
MNHKAWLTTFGIFAALFIGGSAFYAFSGYSKYSDAMGSWDVKVRTIESLERKVPYPSEGNAEALAGKKDEFEKAVLELFESLKAFQRPLDEKLGNSLFQENVKQRVQSFREYAKTEGMALLDDPQAFQLGFDSYATDIPKLELVPYLDYELEAIDKLLRQLVDTDAEALLTFERDPIPGEDGGAERQESGVVHKYPIRLRIRAKHASFQNFINQMANDEEFFYILRVLKVENESPEGPIKLISEDGSTDLPTYINLETKEVASYAQLVEWGYPDTPAADIAPIAREEGFELNKLDARVLMGEERLNVFMVIDIVRFVSPEEQAKSADNGEKSSDRKKR